MQCEQSAEKPYAKCNRTLPDREDINWQLATATETDVKAKKKTEYLLSVEVIRYGHGEKCL